MLDQDSCVIIGAGVSGLIAARTLQASGVRVKVLDKGRGVGGRLATRRSGVGVFDHGAQFFTVCDENQAHRFRLFNLKPLTHFPPAPHDSPTPTASRTNHQ